MLGSAVDKRFEQVVDFLAKPMKHKWIRLAVWTAILSCWIVGGGLMNVMWIVGLGFWLLALPFAHFISWVDGGDGEHVPFPEDWDSMTWGEKIWYRDNMRLAGWELEGEKLPEEKIYGNPYGPGYVMYVMDDLDWFTSHPGSMGQINGVVEVRINGGEPLDPSDMETWVTKLRSERDRQKVCKIMKDTGRYADDVIEEVIRNNEVKRQMENQARYDACDHGASSVQRVEIDSDRLVCRDCGMEFKNWNAWIKCMRDRDRGQGK